MIVVLVGLVVGYLVFRTLRGYAKAADAYQTEIAKLREERERLRQLGAETERTAAVLQEGFTALEAIHQKRNDAMRAMLDFLTSRIGEMEGTLEINTSSALTALKREERMVFYLKRILGDQGWPEEEVEKLLEGMEQ